MIRVLSLGAGVQSTTLLRMALAGEAGDRLDAAIFADTGWEPAAVYAHLDSLRAECEAAGLPLHVVRYRDLHADLLAGRVGTRLPLYLKQPQGRGMLRRQCTSKYKIEPIRRKVRELLGLRPRQRWPQEIVVEQWFGISLDEAAHRMRDPDLPCISHRYPLVEKRMTRTDCLRWLADRGYPDPPKSACIGCPFHDDAYWRSMKRERPGEWEEAVAADRHVRHSLRSVRSEAFLHSALIPLDQIDLRSREECGEQSFLAECEGMCGV